MADTPNGETVVTEALETKTEAPVIPVVEKKTEDSEVERLRKENEQIVMERNLLRNKLDAEEKAKAEAKAKELEEQNEYKLLFEQEKAKNEEIQRERDADALKKQLTDSQTSILSDYSDDVKALAEDAGLSLTDVTDEAVASFKERLDKFQARLGNQVVRPNNPGAPSGKTEYTPEELRSILADPQKRDAYYRAKDGVTAMMMQPE